MNRRIEALEARHQLGVDIGPHSSDPDLCLYLARIPEDDLRVERKDWPDEKLTELAAIIREHFPDYRLVAN